MHTTHKGLYMFSALVYDDECNPCPFSIVLVMSCVFLADIMERSVMP